MTNTASFDPLSQQLAESFHETFKEMRQTCPVARSDQYGGHWVLTKYEDVWSTARDWKTFTNAKGVTAVPFASPPFPILPEECDRPLHREIRKIVDPIFSPKAIASSEPYMRSVAQGLIAKFQARGECEFMSEFANTFPTTVFFSTQLGIESDEAIAVKKWVDVIMSDPPGAASELVLLGEWVDNLFETRRGQRPRSDLIDALMNATVLGRPISGPERLGTLVNLVIGGLETVTSALGNSMYHLAGSESLRGELEDSARIADAVNELLRFDSSAPVLARVATRDVLLGGREVKAGERVLLYFSSANRDEDEFSASDTILLNRKVQGNRHLAFGAGPHRCPGSHLARMELRVALEELLPSLGNFRLAPGAEIEFSRGQIRGPKCLPLIFERKVSNYPGKSASRERGVDMVGDNS